MVRRCFVLQLPLVFLSQRPKCHGLATRKHVTIGFMLFAVFAIHLLSWMFLIGLAGSTVVVLISFYEDAVELFGKDE
jgi:hypothetical protein